MHGEIEMAYVMFDQYFWRKPKQKVSIDQLCSESRHLILAIPQICVPVELRQEIVCQLTAKRLLSDLSRAEVFKQLPKTTAGVVVSAKNLSRVLESVRVDASMGWNNSDSDWEGLVYGSLCLWRTTMTHDLVMRISGILKSWGVENVTLSGGMASPDIIITEKSVVSSRSRSLLLLPGDVTTQISIAGGLIEKLRKGYVHYSTLYKQLNPSGKPIGSAIRVNVATRLRVVADALEKSADISLSNYGSRATSIRLDPELVETINSARQCLEDLILVSNLGSAANVDFSTGNPGSTARELEHAIRIACVAYDDVVSSMSKVLTSESRVWELVSITREDSTRQVWNNISNHGSASLLDMVNVLSPLKGI